MVNREARHQHGPLVTQIERVTEIPMLILAAVYVVAFVVGYLPRVPDDIRALAEFVENVVVALFAAELLVKVAVAERRLAYLRAHWLEVVIVLVPFLRPLRFLRILRLVPVLLRAAVGLRRLLGASRASLILVIGLLAVVVSAGLVTLFESEADGSIKTFGDALWWAATTVTTVGYGDVTPVTAEGRAVAVFLMVVGIALFGVLTAGVAAYFVEIGDDRQRVSLEDLAAKVEALEGAIAEQNRLLMTLLRERDEARHQ